MRGSPVVGAPTSSSSGVRYACARGSSTSSVARRRPDSIRDSVLTDMPVSSASCSSVDPRSLRMARSRGPTASRMALRLSVMEQVCAFRKVLFALGLATAQ
jgi:hypothetical protein